MANFNRHDTINLFSKLEHQKGMERRACIVEFLFEQVDAQTDSMGSAHIHFF